MMPDLKRLLLTAFVLAGLSLVPFVTQASGLSGEEGSRLTRALSFYNTHTNEQVTAVYWRNGRYDRDGLEQINKMLRDHRSGRAREISYDLLNLLHDMKLELQRRHPGQDIVFNIISGYRSPETNAALRARGGGQAKNSRHMHGDAIDIRVPGIDTAELRNVAWCMQRGGVGYYRKSDFVHVDTDRVRFWKWNPSPGLCNRTNS